MTPHGAVVAQTPERQPLSPLIRSCGLVVAAAIIAVDQLTKYLAESRLSGRDPVTVIDGVLQLRLAYNRGAAFSTAASMTEVLTVLSTVVSIVLVVAILRTRSTSWALALGILLGGAVGNLVDRLTRDPGFARGAVVDFLELPRWPVFNVADIAIVTAAILILLINLRGIPFGRARRTSRAV